MKKLTKIQQQYWNMIAPNKGVLYLESQPGSAKSATYHTIARKNNLLPVIVDLSSSDETDMKMPIISKETFTINGKKSEISVTDYSVPRWAIQANNSIKDGYKGALIIIEEINRCRQELQDMALGLINERVIGSEFKFADHVHMVACGNLGEEDNTNVNEFDSALATRFIIHQHNLTINEWANDFANDNVLSYIVSFLKSHPSYFFHKGSQSERIYANPRTWTNLSAYIVKTFGENAPPTDYINNLMKFGNSYVGSAITKFVNYLKEQKMITLHEIINDFKKVEPIVKKLSKEDRSKIDELIHEIEYTDLEKYTSKQLNNIVLFVEYVHEDKIVDFILKMFTSLADNETSSKMKKFISKFDKYLPMIKNSMQIKDD